ncbi:MAG: heparan-alpha-glucosaminide N-acetyltransferase domain-containing protein [Ignavibacteria bacterium]
MEINKKRFAFIDLYRGWALLFMIETHVFNAFLNQAYKHSQWFDVLTFFNGLIAPSFLFISGFAFTIASSRKVAEFRTYKSEFWRQLWRIGLIFLVGYSLRLPYLSLQKMLHLATPDKLMFFYCVDVLQCIAFGLLLLFIMKLIIKNGKLYNYILTGLSVLLFMTAPLIWQIDFTKYMPLPLANYMNPQNGSLFPLFPWLAFMLSGSVISHYYMEARKTESENMFIKWLLYSGIILIIISSFVLWSHLPVFDYISKVNPSQFFFLVRLGLVILLLALCRYYELWRNTESSVVMDVGRESLLVYWLHLQVIYRRLFNDTTLYKMINENFNVVQCLGATVALCVLMIIAAIAWGQIKKRYKKFSQIAVVGMITGLVIFFLFK